MSNYTFCINPNEGKMVKSYVYYNFITLNSVLFFVQKDLSYIRNCLLLISYKMNPPFNVPFTNDSIKIRYKYFGHAMESRNKEKVTHVEFMLQYTTGNAFLSDQHY